MVHNMILLHKSSWQTSLKDGRNPWSHPDREGEKDKWEVLGSYFVGKVMLSEVVEEIVVFVFNAKRFWVLYLCRVVQRATISLFIFMCKAVSHILGYRGPNTWGELEKINFFLDYSLLKILKKLWTIWILFYVYEQIIILKKKLSGLKKVVSQP